MSKSIANHQPIVELECGCTIKDISGEIYQECLPHKQGFFIR